MSETKDPQQHPKVEIAVRNFGPIAEANIDLRPLTVFVGPSNTGKTYFATLVYALHGAFNGLFHSSLLSPFGSEVMNILPRFLTDLTTPKEEIQEILDKLDMDERPFKLSDLPESVHEKLGTIIKDTDFFREELRNELRNCFNLNSISELMRLTGEQRNDIAILLKIGEKDREYLNIGMRVSESEVNLNNLTSLNISSYNDIVLLPNEWSASGRFDDKIFISGMSMPAEKGRYYLPAARSNIMQSHRIIASSLVKQATQTGMRRSSQFPTMSGVIADLIEKIILYEEKKDFEFDFDEKMQDPAEMLESDVLSGRILLKSTPSGYPDFYYRPQGVEKDIHLSQASSMVSELAPLVLFLRSLVLPGDTLIIEEPEAHLHPGAQADMAVILARLVRAGVRVIITTHSDWLLQEIGNLIRVGELENAGDEVSELPTSLLEEQVGVWHFQKDGKVEEIPYDRIDGVEPMEYLDVAEDLYNRSARLQNRLEEMKGDSERE